MVISSSNFDFSYAAELISSSSADSTQVSSDASSTTSDATGMESTAASSDVSTSASDSTGDAATTTGTKSDAHEAVRGNLSVKLSFTLDSVEVNPVSVSLQLQSRTASWDASSGEWSTYGDWADASAEKVDLSAEVIADAIKANPDAAYTFEDLALQSVTDEGVYDTRTQYRVIETKIDGADLVYKDTDEAGMMVYTATSDLTDAGTMDYTATVSEDASLSIDDQTETAKLESHTITNVETTKASETTAVPSTMLAPTLVAPQVTQSFSFTNTVYNYGANDVTTYTATLADGAATFTNATQVSKTGPDGSGNYIYALTVGQGKKVTIGTTATSLSVNLTGAQTSAGAPVLCGVLSSNPQTLSVTGSNPVASVVFQSQEGSSNVQLAKQWRDGMIANESKLVSDMALALQYSTDGGATWQDLSAGYASLGYATCPTVDVTSHTGDAGGWIYTFTKTLFTKAMVGGALKDVTYRLAETTVPSAYAASYADTDGTILMNSLKKPFTATKKWADNNNAYGTRLSTDEWLATLTLYKKSQNTSDTAVALTTTDSNAEGYAVVIDNGNGTYSITLPNALGYDSKDLPLAYYLVDSSSVNVAAGADVEAGTVYVPTYVNVGTYSSIEGALYSGGTLTNTLTNTMTFNAIKVWKDASAVGRPSASVTLYRYPDKTGSSYETASPVIGSVTQVIDNTVAPDTPIAITLPTTDTETKHSLPTFDESGCKYIYFAKEKLSGGTNTYVKEFKDNGTLAGSNMFLFNGGEMDNTITGTTSVSVTKTWVASARQGIDAKVTMSLDRTVDGVTTTGIQTVELSGFGAETTSQTASFSGLPKYNSEGHLYTYSVSEAEVQTKVNGEFEDATIQVVDGTTYVITADGYRYRQDTTVDASGNTTVKNVLVGNAEVKIDKTFSDGLLASPTTLTFSIYQNGSLLGTYTKGYTGDVDGTAFTDTIEITDYSQLTTRAAGVPESGLLPRYDVTGAQYKYFVKESAIESAAAYGTTTFNNQGESTYADGASVNERYLIDTATISNHKPSEKTFVSVCKNWVDDGDQLHHGTVALELQYNAGTTDSPDWQTVSTGSIDTTTIFTLMSVPDGSDADGNQIGPDYSALYAAWEQGGRVADAAGAFRVVETSLDGNEVVLDANVDAAAHPEHEGGWSFVSTPNQNYDVSTEAAFDFVAADGNTYDFGITNKRVGVEKITVDSTWIDGNNETATRPDSITITVEASQAVSWDGTTATSTSHDYTVTQAADGTWTLDTSETGWLQKYDYSSGKVITYTITGKKMNYTGTDHSSSYSTSSTHTGYTVGDRHTGDIDAYTYTYSLAGSVTPYMNKVWKDMGDDSVLGEATLASRPDIYPILFRSYTDASGTHYEKMSYQDRDWSTKKVGNSNNWWQCIFVSQARYNAEGYEYTYYIAEGYSGVSKYKDVGGYDSEPVDNAGDGTFTFTEGEANTITVDGVTYNVARLDNSTGKAGTIVNRPEDTRVISGTKLWKNLPSEFDRNYLPAVTFDLYRYSYGADASTAVLVAGYTATLASGATSFVFKDATGALASLPKYDTEGRPYNYVVKEVSPGNIGLVYSYLFTDDSASGLLVTNSYARNQSYSVTFTKTWANMPTGLDSSQYPTVKLTLVRYLTDSTGAIINGTKEEAFATATDNGNANGVSLTYSGIDTDTASWGSLAYYGPNGNPYQYEVEETTPDGYVVSDATGEVTANSAGAYATTVSGTYDSIAGSGSGSAALTNAYGKTAELDLAKRWVSDSAYDLSTKPDSVSLKLYRKYINNANETVTEQIDSSGDVVTSGGEITIVPGADGTWPTKAIAGLQVYAPNGNQYTYWCVEDPVPTGYSVTYGPAGTTGVKLTTGKASTITVTNTTTTTSLRVTKAWSYGSGTSDAFGTNSAKRLLFESGLGATPKSITYHIAYSLDGGTTWSVLKTTGGITPASKTVTMDTGGNFATQSFSTLPKQAKNASDALVNVSYKAYEYSIAYADGKTYTLADDSPDSTLPVSFTNVVDNTTSGTSAITNAIPTKQITITKVWDDQKDRDGKRPTSLTFAITRTKVETASDTQTQTVTLTSSDETAENSGIWSATYTVPLYWNVDTSAKSEYTVTENAQGLSALGYTETATSTDGTSYSAATTLDPTTTVPLSLGAAGTSAYFKNTKPHETLQVNPAKVWAFNGATYTGTTTLPTWMQAYMPASLEFTLQYSTDNASWSNADATTNVDFAGVTATHTAAVDSSTGAITVDWTDWQNLPRNKDNELEVEQVPYYYRVVETALGGAFDTSSTTTVNGATAASPATSTVTNPIKDESLGITKSWSNDADNAYGSRPGSIDYTIQQTTVAAPSEGDWTAVSSGTGNVLSANPVNATKADDYAVTISGLPSYDASGTKISYRAVETDLVYGATRVTPGIGASYQSSTTDGKAFTNTLNTTSFSVTKAWGKDAVGLADSVASVTVKLQRTTTANPTESDWETVKGSNGTDDYTATIDHTANATSDSRTWNDLPRYDSYGNAYTYRAIEGAITLTAAAGGSTIVVTPGADPTSGIVGGFTYTSSTTDAMTTINNTPITGSLAVSKIWSDDNDRDGIRPDRLSVNITAMANGALMSVGDIATPFELDDANNWVHAWDDVPMCDAAGNAITYTITENGGTAITGYAPSYVVSGGATGSGTALMASTTIASGKTSTVAFTNTHTPASMSITSNKTWNDASNASLTRPAALTYTLMYTTTPSDASSWASADGLGRADAVQTVAVAGNAAGTCSYTWSELPAYLSGAAAVGTQIHYKVVETPVNGYSTTYDTTDVTGVAVPVGPENAKAATITNTLRTTALTVTKLWVDPNGISGEVGKTSYKVQRSTDGVAWVDYSASDAVVTGDIAKTDSTKTWEGLPAFDLASGSAWMYRAIEISLTTMGGQPVSASGTDTSGTVGGFGYAVSDVSGNTADGWANSVTNTTLMGGLKVSKTWDDADNQDGIRPATISVALAASSSSVGNLAAPVTLDSTNDWSYTWGSIPVKDAAGNDIIYTLTESGVPAGYTAASNPLSTKAAAGTTSTVVFTNTHTPATTSISATKQWANDYDVTYGDRPASVELTLYATYDDLSEPYVVGTADVTAAGAWSTTWAGLPTYQPGQVGKKISYSVVETVPNGYENSQQWSADNPVIVNTMQETSLSVSKSWTDSLPSVHDDVASVTYQLQRSTGESWSDVGSAQAVPTSSTPESYTWENLPTYSAAGKEYAYRAIETAVTLTAAAGGSTINVVPAADLTSGTVGGFDYASTTTGSNLSGWTTAITNSARVTSVSATKAWADDSNRDGVRPESVTFHLWQGTDANSMTQLDSTYDKVLSDQVAHGGGTVTWDNLPEVDASGTPYLYSVTEEPLDTALGYTTAITGSQASGYSVTNTHTPAVTNITATKVWDDQSNVRNLRPDGVELTLYANYVGADGNPVKEQVTTDDSGKAITNPVTLTSDDATEQGDTWSTEWTDLPIFRAGLVGEAVTYTVEETAVDGYTTTYSADGLTVTNKLDPETYGFVKAGDDIAVRGGATFSLTGLFNENGLAVSKTVDVIDADVSGTLEDAFIKGQTYTLKEVTAPAGMTAIEDAEIICGDGGRLSLVDPTRTDVAISDDGMTTTITDAMVSVIIQKTDCTTGEQLSNHDECVFNVTPVNTTFAKSTETAYFEGNDDELTASLCGELRTTAVDTAGAQNIYQIQEVAEPGGYQVESTPVQFIVDQSGNVHVLNEVGDIITSEDGTPTLGFGDQSIVAYFNKVDEAGNTLAGATFEIDGKFADGTTIQTFTSVTSSTELDKLLVSDETYVLKEIAAPSGYDAIAGTATFTVDGEGTITLTSDANGAVTVSGVGKTGMTITIKDTATHVTLVDTGDATKPFTVAGTIALAGVVSIAAAIMSSRRRRQKQ